MVCEDVHMMMPIPGARHETSAELNGFARQPLLVSCFCPCDPVHKVESAALFRPIRTKRGCGPG